MARILSKAINRVPMSLQLPLSRTSSSNEDHDHMIPTIQKGPPTPPHIESGNSDIMSDPFDHAVITAARHLPRSPLITPSEGPDPICNGESKSNTFLLVDDNPINLKMLIMFMKKLKLEYDTATDGKQAVEKYKKSPGTFRCIFMDISMPVMNGFEATRAIRASEVDDAIPRCNIFALTGLASKDAQQEALLSGIDLFLTKPIQLAEIKNILELKGLL